MEKKVTPMSLATKAVAQKASAYNWKSQGTDTVKFGTHGYTRNAQGMCTDSWDD